jgi:hypothetical protein
MVHIPSNRDGILLGSRDRREVSDRIPTQVDGRRQVCKNSVAYRNEYGTSFNP